MYGNHKALCTYSDAQFEAVLDRLRAKFRYSDNTILHYRHLLWVVYKAGFENDLYEDNILWDDMQDPEEMNNIELEKYRTQTMTKVRKSFSINEEIKILNWFKRMDPKRAKGEDIGLAIMFFCGLRNNEACGLDYGNVFLLNNHPDTPVLEIVKTTQIKTSQLKSGGKTSNAPRVIPIFKPLYDFLKRRQNYLECLIAEGKLLLPDGIDMSKLNIVCAGENYLQRCAADNLSKRGRKLFSEIGIDKSEMSFLHLILLSKEFSDTNIDEKEPTTYLFRRNFGTHLYQMGLMPAEIQYLMGHAIETPGVTRNMFADEDTLFELFSKMSRSPYYSLFNKEEQDMNVENPYQGNGTYLVDVVANEPNDDIELQVNGEAEKINVHIISRNNQVNYKENAQIYKIQASAYMNKLDE